MLRDMDLIRRIALTVGDAPYGEQIKGLDGVNNEIFTLHVEWMKEAGLIKATVIEPMSGPSTAIIQRLTWDGCEFVDSVRSDTLWKKAKENVIKPTGSFTFSLLREWLAHEMANGFSTFRG